MARIDPSKLIEDDYSGEWSEDMPEVFRIINKFNQDASGAISSSIKLSQFGVQKIVLNSVVVPNFWTSMTLAAGVTALGGTSETPQYGKDVSGRVYLKGMVVKAAVGTITTLPYGYRPTFEDITLPTWVNTAGTQQAAGLTISKAGVVAIATNAPSTWGSIDCSFFGFGGVAAPACFPIKINSTLSTGRASVVLLGSIVDQNKNGGEILRPATSSLAWHNESGNVGGKPINSIVIDNIDGLVPTRTYTITLWAFPEQ